MCCLVYIIWKFHYDRSACDLVKNRVCTAGNVNRITFNTSVYPFLTFSLIRLISFVTRFIFHTYINVVLCVSALVLVGTSASVTAQDVSPDRPDANCIFSKDVKGNMVADCRHNNLLSVPGNVIPDVQVRNGKRVCGLMTARHNKLKY